MKPPVARHLNRLFEAWLEAELDDSGYLEEPEDIERRFIHGWYNELGNYMKSFKAEHKKQIRQNDQWYPRKWMEKDQVIASIMARYPRIPDILNTLEARKDGRGYIYLLHPTEERYKEKNLRQFEAGEWKHPFAVFVADAGFYDTILAGLEMKRITLQKYLSALCKAGILKKLPKTGKYHNIPIYAVGYFAEWRGQLVLKRFLTMDNKRTLRDFTL